MRGPVEAIAHEPEAQRFLRGDDLAANAYAPPALYTPTLKGHHAIVAAEDHGNRDARARPRRQPGNWHVSERCRKPGKTLRAFARHPKHQQTPIRDSERENARRIDLIATHKRVDQRIDKIKIPCTAAAFGPRVDPAVLCYGKDDHVALASARFGQARVLRQPFGATAAAVETKHKRLLPREQVGRAQEIATVQSIDIDCPRVDKCLPTPQQPESRKERDSKDKKRSDQSAAPL